MGIRRTAVAMLGLNYTYTISTLALAIIMKCFIHSYEKHQNPFAQASLVFVLTRFSKKWSKFFAAHCPPPMNDRPPPQHISHAHFERGVFERWIQLQQPAGPPSEACLEICTSALSLLYICGASHISPRISFKPERPQRAELMPAEGMPHIAL